MYNLMVTDDEVASRITLCSCFPWEEIGFKISQQADNGREALAKMKHNHIDVALCDICMPVMSGLEFACKARVINPKIKIVFLSAHRNFEYAQKALEYNVVKYILKPPRYEEMIQTFSDLKCALDLDSRSVLNNNASKSRSERILDKVKAYIQINIGNACLESAASEVFMSPNYLSFYLKDKTNHTFTDLLISARMERASRLLEDLSCRVYDVSFTVGYSNEKNFSRAFKKY